jgi:hypothetical protein
LSFAKDDDANNAWNRGATLIYSNSDELETLVPANGGDRGRFSRCLDRFLTGCSLEALPAFKKRSDGVIPREELHAYLVQLRQKCQTTFASLSDEQAHQPYTFPWPKGATVSYFELLLYTLRHVQEHAAQLSLFLGQHAIADEALHWVQRAKEEAGL